MILVALVVSVVADVAKETPPVLVHVIASVPDVAQSPERSPFVSELDPENLARFPLAGLPVVVTVPSELLAGVAIPKVRSSVIVVMTPLAVTTVAIEINDDV
jgi:hypothetical protein